MKKDEKFDLFDNIRDCHNAESINQIEVLSEIISQIVLRRMELKISQRKLSQLTNIKQPMIARIETLNTIPRLDTLISIISALDLKISLLDKYMKTDNINISLSFKPVVSYQINSLVVFDDSNEVDKYYGA